jgi:hypothetical protein
MSKETFYFTHDYNARNDDKILELRSIYGAEGYGIFWMLAETMAENSNGGIKQSLIGGLSLGYGVAKDRLLAIINSCIEIGLIYEKDGFFFSKRMLTHKELRNKLSLSGKAGAEKRWGSHSLPIAPPNAKERKGKEIINNGGIEKFILKMHGLGEMEVSVLNNCEQWQLTEIKNFITSSQQNFESIAMNTPLMNNCQNFKIVIQEFVNMIQATNDYQESSQLRRFFGNWVSKKNGTLETFISNIKGNSSGQKNLNHIV